MLASSDAQREVPCRAVGPQGDPLRRALASARLRDIGMAKSLGVDPKAVQRWMGGRVPQLRHRWALADLLDVHEYDLWPHLAGIPSIGPKVFATYPHRGAVLREVWRNLFDNVDATSAFSSTAVCSSPREST